MSADINTMYVNGGPFLVGRRNVEGKWDLNTEGFATRADAETFIAEQDKSFEYEITDVSDIKPIMVSKTTGTLQ